MQHLSLLARLGILLSWLGLFGVCTTRAAPLQLSQPRSPPCAAETLVQTRLAASTHRLRDEGLLFVAGFDPRHWSGELSAHRIAPGSLAVSETPLWRATERLDDPGLQPAQRRIFTHDGTAAAPFDWARLADWQKNRLRGDDPAVAGRQRVDYLRGDRSRETPHGGPLRARASRLGAIVNANLWHTGPPRRLGFEHPGHAGFRARHAQRPPVVYAGANDGMLHAFDARTGDERMAYVPLAAYRTLRAHTSPTEAPRYSVDGHAFTGDADLRPKDSDGAPADWRTVLVGGLAGGGRGFFVLDVTDPEAFSPASVLLDRSLPEDGDATYEGHEDVGHLHAEPALDDTGRAEQIARLNNGRWAVVMGNGVNSPNERPVLLIQYLDDDRRLLRLVASPGTGQSNGLATPRLIDVNGDGTVDVAYAGDLQGQLWKFNLAHTRENAWGASAWDGHGGTCRAPASCTPLFVANDAAAPTHRQPITTAPLWLAHPLGGIQLLFGTGQRLQDADAHDANGQSIYSIWDPSGIARLEGRLQVLDRDPIPAEDARRVLVRQAVLDAAPDQPWARSTGHSVAYTRGAAAASARGWYLDLPRPHERVLRAPLYLEGRKALVTSTAPAAGPAQAACDSGEAMGATPPADAHWLTVLDMVSGRPPASAVFALPGGAGQPPPGASRLSTPASEAIHLPGAGRRLERLSLRPDAACAQPPCIARTSLVGTPGPGVRVDWREAGR